MPEEKTTTKSVDSAPISVWQTVDWIDKEPQQNFSPDLYKFGTGAMPKKKIMKIDKLLHCHPLAGKRAVSNRIEAPASSKLLACQPI